MANIISITALNQYVKTLLESDVVLTDIALRGEISNFVRHFKTGHLYFSLKDEACSVKAVMFRTNAAQLSFAPQNGMRVIVRGRISLYERDGAFQVYAEDMFLDGVGAMQLAFEELKEKLAAEGLFAQEHKQMLPAMPKAVGLVTSKTGAALQDIFNVARRRCPSAHFVLCPVNVQGIEAAPQIAAAIRKLDESGRVDVIIVARGGGSKEDLWVFNDEAIARAAYNSNTPVVSAVGHEIDFTILDFAADLRAPTPSAAAELVMPDLQAALEKSTAKYANICKEIQNRLQICYNKVNTAMLHPALLQLRKQPKAMLLHCAQQQQAVQQAMRRRLAADEEKMRYQAALCASLNPYGVLARGYSIVRSAEGQVIKRSRDVSVGAAVTVKLHKGTLHCTVEKTESEE